LITALEPAEPVPTLQRVWNNHPALVDIQQQHGLPPWAQHRTPDLQDDMRLHLAAALLALAAAHLSAQATALRPVTSGTLVSREYPAASFTVDKAFQYAGGQTIDILKVAGAEQHFFIEAGPDHSIRRFYWLQFEHYYPSNSFSYNYSEIKQTPVTLGKFTLGGDIRTRDHYFTMDDRPGSDSKAAENFLRGKGYTLDGTFVTLRMFVLADSTRRRELMIIYGEALPKGTPDSQVTGGIIARAQAGLRIR